MPVVTYPFKLFHLLVIYDKTIVYSFSKYLILIVHFYTYLYLAILRKTITGHIRVFLLDKLGTVFLHDKKKPIPLTKRFSEIVRERSSLQIYSHGACFPKQQSSNVCKCQLSHYAANFIRMPYSRNI